MPTMFQANPRVDQLRARLGHPIVDADAHQIEMVPLFLDFLREVGGAKMPQRWRDYVALTRRAFRMTPEERSQAQAGHPRLVAPSGRTQPRPGPRRRCPG